mmetsp:Transcript_30621/g.70095  ORF Transcript_30621/g.70095 Transcript_30621/m.70095 type:complete len:237 (-) Transcript_30621:548-1258(-)
MPVSRHHALRMPAPVRRPAAPLLPRERQTQIPAQSIGLRNLFPAGPHHPTGHRRRRAPGRLPHLLHRLHLRPQRLRVREETQRARPLRAVRPEGVGHRDQRTRRRLREDHSAGSYARPSLSGAHHVLAARVHGPGPLRLRMRGAREQSRRGGHDLSGSSVAGVRGALSDHRVRHTGQPDGQLRCVQEGLQRQVRIRARRKRRVQRAPSPRTQDRGSLRLQLSPADSARNFDAPRVR